MAGAATIGRNLGGQPRRHNWDCLCPACEEYPLSLADGDNGLIAICRGGCEWSDIEAALVDYGLYDDDDYEAVAQSIVRQRDPEEDKRKLELARWLCQIRTQDPRVVFYLRSRGLSDHVITSAASTLGFLLRDWHRMLTGRPFPAMVAPIVDLAGDVISAHLTFLKPDGSGQAYQKPAKGEPDRRRQCHSSFKGGTIRLIPADPDRELALAEGIEKALAASELFNVPAWSAVNAGGFKTADIPPEHRRLLIIADNDASGCSQRNAIAGAERWEAERRSVRIWVPPTVGHDASDVLKNRGCND